MFLPSGWFVIGADNQQVKGVRIGSLEAGLALLGEGKVATVVGRLRPDVRVVDVDLAGERGHAAVEELASWCRQRDLWHLVRPSGGEDGRAHVFVAPGDLERDLDELVIALRRQLRASVRAIDLRASGHVRPLSAPHRHGGHTRPYGDLREAMRGLQRARRQRPASPETAPGRARQGSGRTSALPPRPRRRTDLPDPWQTYLRTGAAPPHGGTDQSRTTDELLATVAMLRAGHTAESAWRLITTAHPDAMVRARASKSRWIAWVWNRVVEDDRTYSPAPEVDPEVEAAVVAARELLTALAWRQPPRRRRALLLVGHHVLDRMARTNSRRVPVPERDLVEDTCLTDRKTIRHALRLLHGALGVLHTDTWDPARKDTTSFEFEIEAAPDNGMRVIPPPGSHTPTAPRPPARPAPPPGGTWSELPGNAHALWRALLSFQTPQSPEDLADAAVLPGEPGQLTASERRSTVAGLTALARAGLAHCDAAGQWIVRHSPTADHTDRAGARHREIAEAVASERAAYRAGTTTAWSLERARAAKLQLSKERAWWSQLDASDRDQRRQRWRDQFDELDVITQEQVKAKLAERRLRAGVDEPARHEAWISAQRPDDYTARAIERQRRYEALAAPLRHAHVAAWQRHRVRFGVQRAGEGPTDIDTRALTTAERTPDEHAALLPRGQDERDRAFLDRQLQLVDDTEPESTRTPATA